MAIPLSPLSTPLQPQKVESGAAGIEAAGQMVSGALNDIGTAATQGAQIVSTNRTLTQINAFKKQVGDAQQSIVANPSSGNIQTQQQIVDNAASDSVNVPVLRKDRQLLQKNVQADQQTFGMQAARLTIQTNRREQALNFQQTLPDTLSQIHELAAAGNSDLASKNGQALIENTQNLIDTGVLPASSIRRVQLAVDTINKRAQYLSQNGTKVASDPVSTSIQQSIGMGFNAGPSIGQKTSAAIKVASQQNAQNLQQAKQQALNGVPPTWYITNPSVNEANAIHAATYFTGASVARGQVMAGLSYGQLQSELANLNSPHSILSGQDEGTRDLLAKTEGQIKNNYFAYYTGSTNHGSDALNHYNQTLTALQQSGVLSPADKQQEAMQAEQQFNNGMIAYGNAMGIPAQYIKPIAPNSPTLQQISQAFSAGQDVSSAVATLRGVGRIEPYLSNSLATPNQQETAHLAALSPQPQGGIMVMQANQAGVAIPQALNPKSKGGLQPYTDTQLTGQLLSNSGVQRYLNFVTNIPNGILRKAPIQKALLQTLKYCLATPGNEASQCINHISQNVLPQSSDYQSGTVGNQGTYDFLTKELPQPISSGDAKAVAHYTLARGYENMVQNNILSSKGKLSEAQAQAQVNSQLLNNSLAVTNGPDGSLVVFNKQTGSVVHSEPLTPALVQNAWKQYMASGQFSLQDLRNRSDQPNKPFERVKALEEKVKGLFK